MDRTARSGERGQHIAHEHAGRAVVLVPSPLGGRPFLFLVNAVDRHSFEDSQPSSMRSAPHHPLSIWFLLGSIWFMTSVTAQSPGALDPTYASQDEGFGLGNGFQGGVAIGTRLLPNGRILAFGLFETYDRIQRKHLAVLLPDGRLDPTFETVGGTNGVITAVAIQPDQKIIIVGTFTQVSGFERQDVARLNPDGTVDLTFDAGEGAYEEPWSYVDGVRAVAIQADGKILVGGQFPLFDNIPMKSLVRLNPDGNLDPTFSIGSGFDGYEAQSVLDLLIQPEGKIVVGGEFRYFNGDTANSIIRLNPDGSRDTSFLMGSGFTRTGGNMSGYRGVRKMELLPDGRIELVGEFNFYNGISRWRAAILLPDGSLDTTFDPGDGFQQEAPISMVVQPDGRMVVMHDAYSYDGTPVKHLTRLTADGSLDTTFDLDAAFGQYVAPSISIAIQPDGRFVVTGYASEIPQGMSRSIVRLMPDGGLDHGFAHGTGATGEITAMAIQSDGKAIIGGYFKYFDGVWSSGLARVNGDGTRDDAFDVGEGIYGLCESILPLPDGKTLVGGWFSSYNGSEVHVPIRLAQDGSLDTTFSSPLAAPASITTMAVQSDGKILVGDAVAPWVGSTHWGLTRLLPDGTEDATFNIGTGTLDLLHYPDSLTAYYVGAIAIQPDGKILVGGHYSMMNDTTAYGFIRLFPNGSIDTTFHTGTGFAHPAFLPDSVSAFGIWQIMPQTDGKILISGSFDHYNGQSCHSVIRLLNDGTLDPTFDVGTGLSGGYGAFMLLQPDEKIIVAHDFGSFDGYPSQDIVRLESNGSVDQTFHSGIGCPYPAIGALALQNDGRILIGGTFECYDGIGRNRLARLMGDDIGTFIAQPLEHAPFIVFPNPSDGSIRLMGSDPIRMDSEFRILDLSGRVLQRGLYGESIDLSALPRATYSVVLPDQGIHALVVKY